VGSNGMKALILAAGEGRRLRPFTLDALPLSSLTAVACYLYEAYRGGKRFLSSTMVAALTRSHVACDLSRNIFGHSPTDSPERGRFRVLALTDNVPSITAWANATHYDRAFLEQVRPFTDPGDVPVAITGSGNSPNVVEPVKIAKHLGAETIGLLGFGLGGGKVKGLVDHAIIVASNEHGPVRRRSLDAESRLHLLPPRADRPRTSPMDMSQS
jgi:D-sedoheptulose 7-phosphate isomerase